MEDHQVIDNQLLFGLRVQVGLNQLLLAFLAPALPLRQELNPHRLQLPNSAWLPHEVGKPLRKRRHLVDVELGRERLIKGQEFLFSFFALLALLTLLLLTFTLRALRFPATQPSKTIVLFFILFNGRLEVEILTLPSLGHRRRQTHRLYYRLSQCFLLIIILP